MLIIDICIFLFTLTATFVYACGPQTGPAAARRAPSVPPAQVVPAVPLIPAVAVVQDNPPAPAAAAAPAAPAAPPAAPENHPRVVVQMGRKKRSIDLPKTKKCQGIEFDIITKQKNISRTASEFIENLRSKIKSMQKKFDNTMNNMKHESIGDHKLKMSYKVDAECNAVRHIMLDTLARIETIQMVATKCDCENFFVVFKNDFKEE